MNSEDLYRFMEDASLLTKESLPELRQIIDDFPCFHAARMLYLKNLAVLDDVRFSSELKKMAVYLPDRKKLFQFIEGESYGLQTQIEPEHLLGKDDSFSLIDAFLSSKEEEPARSSEPALLFQPSVSSDYMFWSLSEEDIRSEEEPVNKLRHQDLIDSFIKNDQFRTPGSGLDIPAGSISIGVPASVGEMDDEQAKSLEDSCLTETLARIYVKQKRYDKALQIIRNLSLKYPEKNIYFADQIRFLEKLIINTKK